MSRLEQAVQAANERKTASLGYPEDTHGVMFSDGEFQDRAIFSGWDISHEELVGTSLAVADVFAHAAHLIGLRALFVSAWCDGLLTGLLLASLPATRPGVRDDTGTGGGCGKCIYCQHGQRCPWPEGPPETKE